jgi:beta-phosphoglucomutase
MIRAIIFDLDGTLVDTEPLHFAAFAQVLRAEGIELGRDEYFRRLVGYNDHDCFAMVLAEHGRPADDPHLKPFLARKAAAYLKLIEGRDLLYPGAAAFTKRCAERFPLIIATGTLRDEARLILDRAGIGNLFVDVITAEDVAHGKPEPDCLIAALGRLGFILRSRPPIEPRECLVVEDSGAGLEAARRAGMRTLAVCHTVPRHALEDAADLVRESLAATDLDDVLRRLSLLR